MRSGMLTFCDTSAAPDTSGTELKAAGAMFSEDVWFRIDCEVLVTELTTGWLASTEAEESWEEGDCRTSLDRAADDFVVAAIGAWDDWRGDERMEGGRSGDNPEWRPSCRWQTSFLTKLKRVQSSIWTNLLWLTHTFSRNVCKHKAWYLNESAHDDANDLHTVSMDSVWICLWTMKLTWRWKWFPTSISSANVLGNGDWRHWISWGGVIGKYDGNGSKDVVLLQQDYAMPSDRYQGLRNIHVNRTARCYFRCPWVSTDILWYFVRAPKVTWLRWASHLTIANSSMHKLGIALGSTQTSRQTRLI